MKRTLEIILLLAIIGIVIQLISYGFKDKHEVTYDIVSNKETFRINEIYKKGYYHILITNKNNKFTILLDNDYNKKKKIINNVYHIKNDNMMCIYPVVENTNTNVVCSKENEIYSYDFLKTNSLVQEFIGQLKKLGFNNKSWDNDSSSTKHDAITYYKDNLDNDLYMYIWKYNGFYILKDKTFTNNDIYNRDTYTNNPVFIYDQYYVMPDYSKKYDFNNIVIYDMTNDKVKRIYFDNSLSYNSYFNGMVNNKLYLIDKDNLIQYELNPKKKNYNVVGNKELNAVYYNLEWSTINIYDMTKKDYKFITDKPIDNLKEYAVYNGSDVYFYKKNNIVYQYDIVNDTDMILFENEELNDIQVSNNNLYFISGNTLYNYHKTNGIQPLVKYKEFSFNKGNMYAVYTK